MAGAIAQYAALFELDYLSTGDGQSVPKVWAQAAPMRPSVLSPCPHTADPCVKPPEAPQPGSAEPNWAAQGTRAFGLVDSGSIESMARDGVDKRGRSAALWESAVERAMYTVPVGAFVGQSPPVPPLVPQYHASSTTAMHAERGGKVFMPREYIVCAIKWRPIRDADRRSRLRAEAYGSLLLGNGATAPDPDAVARLMAVPTWEPRVLAVVLALPVLELGRALLSAYTERCCPGDWAPAHVAGALAFLRAGIGAALTPLHSPNDTAAAAASTEALVPLWNDQWEIPDAPGGASGGRDAAEDEQDAAEAGPRVRLELNPVPEASEPDATLGPLGSSGSAPQVETAAGGSEAGGAAAPPGPGDASSAAAPGSVAGAASWRLESAARPGHAVVPSTVSDMGDSNLDIDDLSSLGRDAQSMTSAARNPAVYADALADARQTRAARWGVDLAAWPRVAAMLRWVPGDEAAEPLGHGAWVGRVQDILSRARAGKAGPGAEAALEEDGPSCDGAAFDDDARGAAPGLAPLVSRPSETAAAAAAAATAASPAKGIARPQLAPISATSAASGAHLPPCAAGAGLLSPMASASSVGAAVASVAASASDADQHSVTPLVKALPHVDADWSALLGRLPAHAITACLQALLHERQLLLVCRDASAPLDVSVCLQALLAPLRWHPHRTSGCFPATASARLLGVATASIIGVTPHHILCGRSGGSFFPGPGPAVGSAASLHPPARLAFEAFVASAEQRADELMGVTETVVSSCVLSVSTAALLARTTAPEADGDGDGDGDAASGAHASGLGGAAAAAAAAAADSAAGSEADGVATAAAAAAAAGAPQASSGGDASSDVVREVTPSGDRIEHAPASSARGPASGRAEHFMDDWHERMHDEPLSGRPGVDFFPGVTAPPPELPVGSELLKAIREKLFSDPNYPGDNCFLVDLDSGEVNGSSCPSDGRLPARLLARLYQALTAFGPLWVGRTNEERAGAQAPPLASYVSQSERSAVDATIKRWTRSLALVTKASHVAHWHAATAAKQRWTHLQQRIAAAEAEAGLARAGDEAEWDAADSPAGDEAEWDAADSPARLQDVAEADPVAAWERLCEAGPEELWGDAESDDDDDDDGSGGRDAAGSAAAGGSASRLAEPGLVAGCATVTEVDDEGTGGIANEADPSGGSGSGSSAEAAAGAAAGLSGAPWVAATDASAAAPASMAASAAAAAASGYGGDPPSVARLASGADTMASLHARRNQILSRRRLARAAHSAGSLGWAPLPSAAPPRHPGRRVRGSPSRGPDGAPAPFLTRLDRWKRAMRATAPGRERRLSQPSHRAGALSGFAPAGSDLHLDDWGSEESSDGLDDDDDDADAAVDRLELEHRRDAGRAAQGSEDVDLLARFWKGTTGRIQTSTASDPDDLSLPREANFTIGLHAAIVGDTDDNVIDRIKERGGRLPLFAGEGPASERSRDWAEETQSLPITVEAPAAPWADWRQARDFQREMAAKRALRRGRRDWARRQSIAGAEGAGGAAAAAAEAPLAAGLEGEGPRSSCGDPISVWARTPSRAGAGQAGALPGEPVPGTWVSPGADARRELPQPEGGPFWAEAPLRRRQRAIDEAGLGDEEDESGNGTGANAEILEEQNTAWASLHEAVDVAPPPGGPPPEASPPVTLVGSPVQRASQPAALRRELIRQAMAMPLTGSGSAQVFALERRLLAVSHLRIAVASVFVSMFKSFRMYIDSDRDAARERPAETGAAVGDAGGFVPATADPAAADSSAASGAGEGPAAVAPAGAGAGGRAGAGVSASRWQAGATDISSSVGTGSDEAFLSAFDSRMFVAEADSVDDRMAASSISCKKPFRGFVAERALLAAAGARAVAARRAAVEASVLRTPSLSSRSLEGAGSRAALRAELLGVDFFDAWAFARMTEAAFAQKRLRGKRLQAQACVATPGTAQTGMFRPRLFGSLFGATRQPNWRALVLKQNVIAWFNDVEKRSALTKELSDVQDELSTATFEAKPAVKAKLADVTARLDALDSDPAGTFTIVPGSTRLSIPQRQAFPTDFALEVTRDPPPPGTPGFELANRPESGPGTRKLTVCFVTAATRREWIMGLRARLQGGRRLAIVRATYLEKQRLSTSAARALEDMHRRMMLDARNEAHRTESSPASAEAAAGPGGVP
ncbi:hypothetical protein FNF29_02563 [Cafeteria roenbergensis]|uniref:Uncharacterized protein n=1 Tax=Cafeteria roenbergensis TaxID=33653 RepID=A0A5A8CMJ5_CAFRO|nr:hypothetical protein FNF29_02563 [Cafeteria roenbergensis]|eukprot:KAA0154343.1 hypothetical protein FNF29_02563 [Cafeteria roenbergensis]